MTAPGPSEAAEIELQLLDFWDRYPSVTEDTTALLDHEVAAQLLAESLPTYAERCAARERIGYERRRRAHYHEPDPGPVVSGPEPGGGRFIRYVWDEDEEGGDGR